MGTPTQEQITVFVHGTFGNPGYHDEKTQAEGRERGPRWWRLTKDGRGESTADRLRSALAAIDPGLAETVWEPGSDPRDGDLGYPEMGEWSGDNSHAGRKRAAADLASSLKKLADRRACGAESPLLVNFVAHSHGGNVVLEALKRLSDNVAPRQLCMLGTPLTWRFFDPRIFYLGYIYPLFFGMRSMAPLFWEGFNEGGSAPPGSAERLFEWLFGVAVLVIVLLPIYLWFLAGLHRLFRGAFAMLPWSRPAYGPRPAVLEQQLRGRPAVLFISREDEADIMLQVGAAPLDAYRAMIRGRPKLEGARSIGGRIVRRVLRCIEIAYVRPFAYAILIPTVEVLLERLGLGFPIKNVLFSTTKW